VDQTTGRYWWFSTPTTDQGLFPVWTDRGEVRVANFPGPGDPCFVTPSGCPTELKLAADPVAPIAPSVVPWPIVQLPGPGTEPGVPIDPVLPPPAPGPSFEQPGLASCGAYGAFPDQNGDVRLLCYDVPSGRWFDQTAGAFSAVPRTASRPDLAFHVARAADGSPLYEDALVGQLWLTATVAGVGGPIPTTVDVAQPQVWISNPMQGALPGTTVPNFARTAPMGDLGTRVAASAGVDLFEDLETSALKGIWWNRNRSLAQSGSTTTIQTTNSLQLLPFVDGSFEAQITDGNDFQVLERTICLGIQGTAWCGGPATSPYGY
jgi:hypothetical protein